MSSNSLLIGGVIFLGVLVFVAVVLVVIQLVRGRSGGGGGGGCGGGKGPHSTTLDPSPPTSYTCKKTTPNSDAVLYIMPEANGFNVKDLVAYKAPTTGVESLIDPVVAKNNFKNVAVVANYSDPNFENHYTDPLVTNIGLPLNKWIVFYFGKDGPYCKCQNGADENGMIKCGGAGDPCTTCKANNDSVKWQPGPCNLCKYKDPNNPNKPCFPGKSVGSVVEDIFKACNGIKDLRGIMYDDETGDPAYIVKALELVKEKWDQANPSEPPLMLGSTGTLSSSKKERPRDEQGECTWDIVLGQAYTDTTADYYTGSCKPDLSTNGWWYQVGQDLGDSSPTKGVPMVCGAGDCVGDVSKKSNTPMCYDERLSGDMISTLISNRPADFKWKNFGIWYGTTAAPCGFQNCYASTGDCKTACCPTEWKLDKLSHAKYCS